MMTGRGTDMSWFDDFKKRIYKDMGSRRTSPIGNKHYSLFHRKLQKKQGFVHVETIYLDNEDGETDAGIDKMKIYAHSSINFDEYKDTEK